MCYRSMRFSFIMDSEGLDIFWEIYLVCYLDLRDRVFDYRLLYGCVFRISYWSWRIVNEIGMVGNKGR